MTNLRHSLSQWARLSLLLIGLAFLPPAEAATHYSGHLAKGVWQASWNEALEQSIASSSLLKHTEPRIEKICKGYNADFEKRKIFWQQLFIALSWKESIHGAGNYVYFGDGINIGLFQIDPLLENAYDCNGYNLYSAKSNIKCAVKMADDLVQKFGSFLVGTKGGMAAYWQPLRATDSGNKTNRNFILNKVATACQTETISYISTEDDVADFDPSQGPPKMKVNTLKDLTLSAAQRQKIAKK